MKQRKATVKRATKETNISVTINLDGKGNYRIDIPVGFLKHMLELFSKHSLFDLNIKATGDLEIDYHHTVEDLGIVLGESFKKALGTKSGIDRFGLSCVPMDDALTIVAVDISGRPYLNYDVRIRHRKVGEFPVYLIWEFLRAFVQKSEITLHIRSLSGKEPHHILESVFKSLARALLEATRINPRRKGIPSTKGKL